MYRALLLASALVLTLFSPAHAAAPNLSKQKLTWKACVTNPKASYPKAYRRLQCAKVKVPADWKHPKNGKTITLRVSRLKATGRSEGVVFTNPGGPGQVGWTLPLAFVDAKRTKLLKRMDVIGIDVRGTGYSTQIHCRDFNAGPTDARDRSAKNVAAMLGVARKFAQACQKGSGTLGKNVTTEQTVKDLDLIRAVLKQKKINWIGYSAGTWLGAAYARYFPKHTGRFVLDSVVDLTGTWQQANNRQAMAFERRFRQDFAPWAAARNGEYATGTTGQQVLDTYEKVRKRLAATGGLLVEDEDGFYRYVADDLDNDIASALYSKYLFGYAANTLAVLQVITDPGLRTTRKLAVNPYAGEDATFLAIQCNDTKFTGTPKSLTAASAATGAKYPLIGWQTIYQPCQYWKRPAGTLKRPNFAHGPRMLMIQSEHDPATPYEGAVKTRKAYKNSRLVTVTNEGDHALYAGDNPCVDQVVEAYLLDGVWPKKDLSCAGENNARLGGSGTNVLVKNREIARVLN